MFLLAQISSDMLGPLVPWLGGFSLALFLLNQALTFYKDHMREKPTPSDTYATKKELDQVHGRIKRERDEINSDISELKTRVSAVAEEIRGSFVRLDDKRSASIAGLHFAIKESVNEIRGEIREDFNGVHNRMTELVREISEIDGRTKK